MKIQHNSAKQRYEAIDDTDGTVAGFAAYRDRPGSRAFTHTEVSEAYAGQGVASQLLQVFERFALGNGLAFLTLEVRDANAPARALYASAGFTRCPPFGSYRDDPNSVFMTLVLPMSQRIDR